MEMERVRGPDGKLTNWVTGARMAWIEVPKEKIDGRIDCGVFKASIFYREMLDDMECRNCLRKGHKMKNCKEPERCRRCHKVGHKIATCGEEIGDENEGLNENSMSQRAKRQVNHNNQREEESLEGKYKNEKQGEKHDERRDGLSAGQTESNEIDENGKNLKEDGLKIQPTVRNSVRRKGSSKNNKSEKVMKSSDKNSSDEEVENEIGKNKRKDKKKIKDKNGMNESTSNSESDGEIKKVEENTKNRGRPSVKEI